jgi:GNAT superfamily N-acetyltransferase
MIDVRQARSSQELDHVRQLMQAFLDWHLERHVEDRALIERYFDQAAFEQELEVLPGKYSPPRGSLLVAYHGEAPVGCVAMRDLGEGACEMKRMFVAQAARGLGVGGKLAQAIIEDARRAGYSVMRLDTSKRQDEAMRLYVRSGFSPIAPYYPLSPDLKDWLVFFELAL